LHFYEVSTVNFLNIKKDKSSAIITHRSYDNATKKEYIEGLKVDYKGTFKRDKIEVSYNKTNVYPAKTGYVILSEWTPEGKGGEFKTRIAQYIFK
jgi:hypothetical protein